MPARAYEIHGVRVFECAPEGPRPRNDRDAVELMSAAWEHGAGLIVIPVEQLGGDFFRLSSGIAGEILQKFATYGVRVAIVGDISGYVAASASLRDFVYESNRGGHIWFVPNLEELGRRLKDRAKRED
jgi:hypothetical protein